MVDKPFDSRRQRDKAADEYRKRNPGKSLWKTQTKRTTW